MMSLELSEPEGASMKPTVKEFFDPATWTMTYVVYDEATRDAVIIDPVWDYDPAASKVWTDSIELVANYARAKELKVHTILETHAHADHLSGSQPLKEQFFPGAKVAIGANITAVQEVFKNVFNLDPSFTTDGSQFDLLLNEGEILKAGSLEIQTLFTPGHTPACSSYIIGDAVFTGDALFMPDYGTGRCDFPAGSADDLYSSVHDKLYKLPEHYRVFVGHDYLPNGRELEFETTIGESKANNIQLKESTSREQFVKFRTERDATLKAPRLLLPSVQVNIDAGRLPNAESNGVSYLKIPLRK
jgi:glyoxylase-like metal-dependent hydrolase (beta-lactamase superfamily II)